MKKTLFAFVLLSFFTLSLYGQTDPVLFTVNGKPVTLSEFNYIYTKTNGAKADFSESSVMEYLDLYTKFKMKVARAREMQLDTLPPLMEELDGYRRQLADSYLTDREVTDKLVKEAHERMLRDISIRHIMCRVEKNDTVAAYKRILEAQKKLVKGSPFAEVAKEFSDDPSSKDNGGNIGYLTAMLPEGFYELESAIYATPIGDITTPVRSPLGYHIVQVNAERPARGEIEVAHILIRKKKEGVDQPLAQKRADMIYEELKAGKKFEELANQSEDLNSSTRGGVLPAFGIGRYEPIFEDAAFSLEKDGDYTKPIETSIGYHIIKRLNRRPVESLENMKSRLKARIQRDPRHELARMAMVERIKREGLFRENKEAYNRIVSNLDSNFLTYAWPVPASVESSTLFSFGNTMNASTTSVQDWVTWLTENANRRINYATQFGNKVAVVADKVYQDYVAEKALAYEEMQLETKYPDFKNLMREYEEGILLFEAIKQNVWDKASQDSVGLEKFFADNKSKYNWNERASLVYYTVSDSAKASLEKIKKDAKKKTPQQLLAKYNKKGEVLKFREETVERDKGRVLDAAVWKVGYIVSNGNDPLNFMKTEKITAKTPKSLKDARGYVVADYQEFLEKQWMAELMAKYPVDIKRPVLSSIIKK